MTTHTKSPAAAILCLSSLLASLAGADVTYSTDTTLTANASLGMVDVTNAATLTIQSGVIQAAPLLVPKLYSETGRLVMNGGNLLSGGSSLEIGNAAGSNGRFELNGGSVTTRFLKIGEGQGTAAFVMTNGQLTSEDVTCGGVANDLGSPGTGTFIQVDGGTWINTFELYLGTRGAARLHVNNGTVYTRYLTMGYNIFQAQIVQAGGSLTVEDFRFGWSSSSNTVSAILSGGVFTATAARLGYNGAGGVVTLKPGGVFATAVALLYSPDSGISFEGGTLRAIRHEPNWIAGFMPGSLALEAGGGIVDTQAFNVGTAGPFTGPGALTKTGSGTLTLSGGNAHTGGTLVSEGTLALSGSVQLGTGNVTIQPGGTLAAGSGSFSIPGIAGGGAVIVAAGGVLSAGSNNASTTFSGSISGDGEFSKTGTGTLTFSGNANQSGPANVSGGTLAVAAGGVINAPSSGINVANTGTASLALNGGTVTAGSVIIGHDGGTATVTLNGGTLTTNEIARWSVPSTIAFNGGTLRAAGNTSVLLNGFTSGSAVIQAGGLTVDTNGFTVSTVAELSGPGGLTKTGAGSLSLDGTATTYSGPTTVAQGTLKLATPSLNDSSPVSLAPGADLWLLHSDTDLVGSLTIDGQLQAPGTWGSPASTADHKTARINGPGMIEVVAHPDWLRTFYQMTGPSAADQADADGDGVANIDEFYAGTDPTRGNAPGQSGLLSGNSITFTFSRRKAIAGVSAEVEWSGDMNTWSTAGVGAPVVLSESGGVQQVQVAVPAPPTASRRYVRLRVEGW